MTTDGALRIIHLLKFAGYSGLALPVGHAVAWALRRFAGTAGDIGIVVPTPMDRRSQRRRGFNHAERIAEVVSGEFGVPLAADVLLKTVRTRRQSLTAREARAENVRRAFSCPAGAASLVSGRPVLLVDDLVTSGATAEACASALFDAEAASVTVACFGRAL
jgi:predicted amidophosphoribosyltransferase